MKKLITSSGTLLSCLIAMAMMLCVQSARAQYVPLTYLDGMLSWGQYGLGSETYDKLVDQDINTKWGGWFDPSLTDEGSWPNNEGASANKMYIIVKAKTPVVPSYYFLVTGNDTKNSNGKPDRNWLEWKIYGGNFADDTLAVREGEGWTLVEHHTADDEALPNDNFAYKNFACSENVTTAFQYFWIEIISTVAQSETYQQMGEFGFGTYAQFQSYLANKPKPDTDIDEPLVLYVLEGTSMSGNEGLPYLFDGKTTTKWCTGFTGRQEGETTNGAYFIVQCSRTIVPSYYVLTTANDTERWSGRNWKQWQIYGMNAESLDEVKRNSTEWVAIDKKYNVGTDQLPAANYTPAYFGLSEPNTTGYKFFKVEIDQIASGGTMQMSEFSLGDQYQFEYDRESIKTNAQAKYDPNLFAEKALLDRVPELIADVEACTDPMDLANLSKTIDKLFNDIEASVKNYAELITTRNQIALAIDAENVDATAIAYLTTWMSETDAVAPSAAYPCGNFAYIKANRHITGDEAAAEVKRINAYMLNHSTVEVVPITAKYKFISGTTDNWQLTEGPEYLIDGQSGLNGTSSTKWGTGTSGDRFIIFKSINAETGEDEAIQPTYYGLVTGGDTQTYTDRNWKNWKIWGANFTADSLATKNSSDWVLIDVKENVGTDILKTTNCFESYIYLSIGCAEPYTHFKIEVYHSGGMQMNEFTFYNTGNLMDYRDGYVKEFEDYDPRKEPAFKDHILAYESKYEELQTTVYAPDVMKFKNELTDLQKTLNDSRDLYAEYDSLYTELSGLSFDSESMSTWWNSYSDDYIAPSNKFIRGSHNYIVGLVNEEETNLGMLNDDEIQEEFDYIQWIYNAVDNSNDCHYILLGGHTVGQFGDGFYGHLIDGIAKDWKDASGTHKGTKWGGNADENGNTYMYSCSVSVLKPK